MYAPHPHRTLSAASSLAIVCLIGLVLVWGLSIPRTLERAVPLTATEFTLPPPPPPPTPPPQPPRPHDAAKDEAGARNIRNQATPVVAPTPPVQLIVPPPVVTAPVAGVGAAANNGASDLPGPGQGAGGFGNGRGGGGDGGDGDAVVGPRHTSGRLSWNDLPEGMLPEGTEAAVEVLYTVNVDGSVSHCHATHSSGYPAVDALACRLIEQRFRFRPAMDADNRPVRSQVIETHTWVSRG